MQTSEFDAGLARQKRRALMCAEAVPWRCHRPLIADALTVLEIPIDKSIPEFSVRTRGSTSIDITKPGIDRV
jgi:uncharacterized protein (DUF488 family)